MLGKKILAVADRFEFERVSYTSDSIHFNMVEKSADGTQTLVGYVRYQVDNLYGYDIFIAGFQIVNRARRGQGLGTLLINRFISEQIAKNHAVRIGLHWDLEDNRARTIYQKMTKRYPNNFTYR